eukprot:s2321_g13.t1
MDPAAIAAARAAPVVASWQQASDAADKERPVKAEARVMGLPKPLLQTERQAMRTALERATGHALAEQEEPSPEYLATKMEEIGSGDMAASTLAEITCVKDNLQGHLYSRVSAPLGV